MTDAEPGWELWRAFGAVMQAGTLSGAARRLGLTQPTIGRQIEALEQKLGYPLFVRSRQGLAPTEAAQTLAPLAASLAATAGALERASAGVSSGGVVRVTASDVVAAEVLPEMLALFRAKHGDIEIEVSASNTVEDLLTREADLAVRMTRPTQQALVAKKIGTVPVKLWAHPDYLKRNGAPETLDDLIGHSIIGYDKEHALLDYLAGLGVSASKSTFAIRCDNELVQHAMVRAGLGVGGMQTPLAKRSGLAPLLHDALTFPLECWLVTHEDLRRAKAVRLLFDHLERSLSAYIAS
jgi:DNA-binding transcriptional LysR family regulator